MINLIYNIEIFILVFIFDFFWNLFSVNKVKLNLELLKIKLGIFGELMIFGFIFGVIIGVLGSLCNFVSIDIWGGIFGFVVVFVVVMIIFFLIMGVFVSVFVFFVEVVECNKKKES